MYRKTKNKKEVHDKVVGNESVIVNSENEEDIVFYVDDLDNLHLEEEFKISNYYIRNKVTLLNHYYIDAIMCFGGREEIIVYRWD